jgi:putative ABC transport system permease protein
MFQFLSESIVLSFIALALGLALVHILLPAYRNLVGRPLHMHYFDNAFVVPALLGLGLLVGVISGSYPAFFLSSFKPVTVLRGSKDSRGGGTLLRNVLVIFQFAISIFLIVGTLAVFQQLKYFQNTNLGFDKEQVLVVRNPGALGNALDPFKENLRGSSQVVNVSSSNSLPGRGFNNIGFGAEGVENNFTLNLCVCDYNFLDTLKLEMAQGRFFSREFSTDSHAAVLNERAAKLLGWDNPLGKKINNWARFRGNFIVIGVIKDYHYESLHQDIRPQALFLSGGYYKSTQNFISIRFKTQYVSEIVGLAERTWKNFAPGKPFEYSFLDKDYENLYINEKQTRSLFSVFSFLAVFIACLGLFGLASFVADRRTKEIGIRKILGASVPRIVKNLNTTFVKWVLLANIIAWPAAWFFMTNWLQNFAYRIRLSWWMFALAAALALFIALLTISFQTVRAALKNPVDSLRYE